MMVVLWGRDLIGALENVETDCALVGVLFFANCCWGSVEALLSTSGGRGVFLLLHGGLRETSGGE